MNATMNMVAISSIGAVVMAVGVMFVRIKASAKPTNAKKIVLPPIFMSTGALMYIYPPFRLTPAEIIEAILVGMFFSIFLIKTSKFEIRDGDIYLKRSKWFIVILVGLLLIRVIMKSVMSSEMPYTQLGGMFFLLAYSMILPWRIAMLIDYRKLYKQLHGAKN
jgi:membrane protein CcdC involved in cytochrome C biogenesis